MLCYLPVFLNNENEIFLKTQDLQSTQYAKIKDCKNKYFSYFNENIKDVKKTWTGIKSIIYMKSI